MRHGPALETASLPWDSSDRPRPRCRLAAPDRLLTAEQQIFFLLLGGVVGISGLVIGLTRNK